MRKAGMHVFVVGRQRAAATEALRGVVHDWSAVDLVDASIWIDVQDAEHDLAENAEQGLGGRGNPASLGVLIDEGIARSIDLRSWIPRNPGPVRLIALQTLTEPSGAITAEAVHAVVAALRLPPGTPLVNLLIPVDGLVGVPPEAVFDSQVNVLVQPVDGTGPLAATEPLTEQSPTFVMHGAAALATAAGLWSGMRTAPLDEERSWSGVGVAVSRSYFRKLDAAPILDRLATEVFGAQGSLPATRSRVGEPMGVVAPAVQQQASEAAGYAVLEKHAEFTRFRPPPAFLEPRQTPLGFWQAVRMFCTFVGRALVNAPQNWAKDVIEKAKTEIENTTTAWVFGDHSQYAVVLTGLQAGGSHDIDQAQALQHSAVVMLGKLAPGSEPATVAAPRLWDDTVRTVSALIDGGEPDSAIPLPSQGSARLVINDPARISPAPGTEPFVLPPGVPGAQFGPIAANDPWHAMQIDKILDDAARETGPNLSGSTHTSRVTTAGQARTRLSAWVAGKRSSMWAISSGLATELDKARSMQAAILQPRSELTEEELQAALRAQRRARQMVLVWLLVLLVLVGVCAVVAALEKISWATAAGVMVGITLFCFVGAVISFQRGQRALMHALYRMRVAAARRAWVQEHAVTITQEVVRLAGLYRQSRAWSEVVAEYVHAPFGQLGSSAAEVSVPSGLTGDLPLAVTLASAQFSARAHEPVIYQARAQMLRPDWLFTVIDERRRLVIEEIRERTGRDLENRITSDATLMEGGPLLSYLEGLRDPAVQARTRQRALAGLVKAVGDAGVQDRLLPSVRVDAGAMQRTDSWQELTNDLFNPPTQLAYEGFSATGVTNRSPTVGRSFLAADPALTARAGLLGMPVAPGADRHQLDRLVVRWDLSQPAALEDLTYFGASTTEPGPVPDPLQIIDVES
ncbi:MAG: hypothetical protein ABWZ02_06340 [Nakamurella sp.]